MKKLIIDGDSAPGLDVITNIVKNYNIEAYIYCDYTHSIVNEYITVINIDQGYQNVDMKILSVINNNDILITNDYGLASLALTKDVTVINYKGIIYNKNSIDDLLHMNYINKKIRMNKGHIKGPKKRSKEDDKSLELTLIKVINDV